MTQPASLTMVEVLARQAAARPEGLAFTAGSDQPALTFKGLWERVSCLAAALHARGVRAGERVAIALPNCIDWSVWEYAAQAIGAVPVGLGLQWSPEHMSAVLEDCHPAVVVLAGQATLEALSRDALARCETVCLRDASAAAQGVHRGLCTQSELFDNPARIPRAELPRPSDPATIVYTSGSTGQPKGVAHTHARVMTAVDAIIQLFPELQGGRLALSWMPMEHLFQRMLNLVALSLGMPTRILSDPRQLLAVAQRERPTFLAGVPVVFEQLLREATSDPNSFAGLQRELKVMIVGSAPIAVAVLEGLHALGFPVTQAYSTTECLVPIASNTLTENRLGSVGKVVPSYDLRLSDAGEIMVRGPGVFTGYYGHAAPQDARLFDRDGYYNTGDTGYLDDDGYLFITGRSSDLIKTSAGRKISPFEIESAYKSSPYIENMVVSGHGRRHLVALVQLEASWADNLRQMFTVAGDDSDSWAQDTRVVSAVLAEMQRFESSLDGYKRVRRIAVLAQPLSTEQGELTATLKLRRDVIEARHRTKLDRLTESA